MAILVHCFRVELDCGVLVFLWREKSPRSKDVNKNKLNPHVAPAGPGIDTGLQR